MNHVKDRIRLLVICALAVVGLFSVVSCGLLEGGSSVPAAQSNGPNSPTSSGADSPTPIPSIQPTATPEEATSHPAEIAFVKDGDLWVGKADGAGQKKLVASGQINSLVWSRDGTKIAVVEASTSSSALSVLDIASGVKKTLAEAPGTIADPTWSPDGSEIVYSATADSNGDQELDLRDQSEIWLVDREGNNRRKVTDGRHPSWSPDGRRLAFVSTGDLKPEPPYRADNAIELIGVQESTGETILAVKDLPDDLSNYNYPFKPSTILLQRPAWSPDGRRIGFSTVGHTGLMGVIDANGENLKLVGFNYEGSFGSVTWAPSGHKIAGESFPPSGISHIVINDLDSGNTVNVGKEPSGPSLRSPSWSPDSRNLLAVGLDGKPYLASLNADSAELRVVATGAITAAAWNPAANH